MDKQDEKRKIMIREIEHWRKSRLLPEQYCDFLMNLYVDNDEKPSSALFGLSPSAIRNSNWKNWTLFFFVMGVISFTALNFSAFELPMQIGVSFLFLAVCYLMGGWKRYKEPMASQIYLGTASLYVLFIGVYILRIQGIDAPVPIVAYVVLCSLIWILTGLLARLVLFQLCGWVSLVFCYGWLLHHQLDSINWVTLELSWVPLSLLFCWMAWVIHEKSKQIGLVFFLLSLIVWYMPELYGMLYAEKYGKATVQTVLFVKMAVEGILLYTLRKKWTEWVA
ncbi:hypothetical protein [Paenibacillus silviterrae]|uniref:hypothetical protein n=1 Tax=Paenibacillus silviterrae TaxID=3242194 RepID=UPI0025430568|nr:hypothetical protein [Paenibacillus chinjuensis]